MRYGITEGIYAKMPPTKRRFCIKKNHWFLPFAYTLCKTEWPWFTKAQPKVGKLSTQRLDFISKDSRYFYEELCQECLKKLPRKLHNKIKYNFIVAKLKS